MESRNIIELARWAPPAGAPGGKGGSGGRSPLENMSLDSEGKTTQFFEALRALLSKGLSKQARGLSDINLIKIQTSSLL